MSRVFDESFEYLRSRAWGTSTYDCASVTGVLDGWLANIAGYDDYLRWLKRHIDEKRKAIASRPQRRTFIKRLEEWVSFFAESKKFSDQEMSSAPQREYDDFGILRRELGKYPRRREVYALAGGNALTVAYLQRRACDITRFGKDIAGLTFPQPELQGATGRQVTDLVAGLALTEANPVACCQMSGESRLIRNQVKAENAPSISRVLPSRII